tara:strand:+ start:342 stop:668 length:327 start_codon:yes stop_codon:yes gene_type:complete
MRSALFCQLPTMKLMAAKGFPAAHEQSIPMGSERAISHLQVSFPGMEGQQSGHAMHASFQVAKALPEKQHATAFGVNRMHPSELLQSVEAAVAVAQLFSMLFGEAAGQ